MPGEDGTLYYLHSSRSDTGCQLLFVFVFVWVGAHQHRQADRGLSKNLLKYGGYAFFVSSVSYWKIIEISSLFNIFFSYRVYHGFVVKIIEMLWGFKKEHTYFSFGWTWFSIFLSTLHTVTHWVIFTNFLSLNLKICCSKLQSCPKYFVENRVRDCAWINKKRGSEHIYKIKVNFDLIFFFLQR